MSSLGDMINEKANWLNDSDSWRMRAGASKIASSYRVTANWWYNLPAAETILERAGDGGLKTSSATLR